MAKFFYMDWLGRAAHAQFAPAQTGHAQPSNTLGQEQIEHVQPSHWAAHAKFTPGLAGLA